MKSVWAIMSKEFTRFFTDKRMIMMTILPAIGLYVVYTFMGTMMVDIFGPDEDHVPRIYAVNMSVAVAEFAQGAELTVINIDAGGIEEAKTQIEQENADLLMIFPQDFDEHVAVFDVQTATAPAPNIEIYFLSTNANSHVALSGMMALLDAYESSLANKFDINRGIENADLATVADMTATVISSIMPMMLMIFLFSGCMGLALESITGEKERGTLATLLVSPLKRRELAIGKILSLAALSLVSGGAMAIAMMLSLPQMMGTGDMIENVYSATDFALLGFLILTTLLLMVALISIVSAFAKTVKEATTAVTPLMFVFMGIGLTGMIGGGPQTEAIFYVIPIYGTVQAMTGIFALDYSVLNIIIASLCNIAFAIIGGFVLTKMFSSEKVMFSK